MARRLHGDILVRRRPNGYAVLTLKSASGEEIEIERTPEQIEALVALLAKEQVETKVEAEAKAQAEPEIGKISDTTDGAETNAEDKPAASEHP